MAEIPKDKQFALVNSCDLWWGREVVELKKDKAILKGVDGAGGPAVYHPTLCSIELGKALIEQITALHEDYRKKATEAHENYKALVQELIKDL